jgi:hypothetical protein
MQQTFKRSINIAIIFLDSDFKKCCRYYILKVGAKYGQIMAYARLHTINNNYVIDMIDSNKNYAEYPMTS